MGLELIVVTPEGQAYSGTVEQVVLPGSEGRFGVLEAHERYLAPLRGGAMEIQTSGGSTWAALSAGFADVSAEQVVVLVDGCLAPGEIDIEAARAEAERARGELGRLGLDPTDQALRAGLESDLARVEGQIEVHAKA